MGWGGGGEKSMDMRELLHMENPLTAVLFSTPATWPKPMTSQQQQADELETDGQAVGGHFMDMGGKTRACR